MESSVVAGHPQEFFHLPKREDEPRVAGQACQPLLGAHHELALDAFEVDRQFELPTHPGELLHGRPLESLLRRRDRRRTSARLVPGLAHDLGTATPGSPGSDPTETSIGAGNISSISSCGIFSLARRSRQRMRSGVKSMQSVRAS